MILISDGLGRRVVDQLTPALVESAFIRWTDAGAGVATVSARFRVLHSAISWAMCERLLWADPLAGMHAPPRPYPRKHLRPELGRQLITAVEQVRDKAQARVTEQPQSRGRQLALFRAEQDVLLVRLVADSGLRRGELAALRIDDLDGRVLSVERAAKAAVIGPTKTYQRGRLTLGLTVAQCWVEHVAGLARPSHDWHGPRPLVVLDGPVGAVPDSTGWTLAAFPAGAQSRGDPGGELASAAAHSGHPPSVAGQDP